MRSLVTGMPVAGFTGSLTYRFAEGPAVARGLVRAKTGTLTGVHALAGIAVDRDGQPLAFVFGADKSPPIERYDAQEALDRAAASLAACRCRRWRPYGWRDRGSRRRRADVLVDWDFAVTVGARVAGPGPEVSPDEAAAAVVELREGATRSTPLVREFTGLHAEAGTAPVLVVDRSGWVQANADGFAKLLSPVVDKLIEKKGPPSALAEAIGSRVTGAEVGLMLGFLSSKVLGQFDPFHEPHGRLLLVAPNIVHVEREIGVDPTDFRLWVCLHEETHRVQFTAVPWLRRAPLTEMHAVADTSSRARCSTDSAAAPRCVRGGGGSIIDLARLARAEGDPRPGHRRDVAARGPRRRRDGRRRPHRDPVGGGDPRGSSTSAARASAPSTSCCAACSASTPRWRSTATGPSSSATSSTRSAWRSSTPVWTGPETLPSKAEISDPDAWIARVL